MVKPTTGAVHQPLLRYHMTTTDGGNALMSVNTANLHN